MSQSTAPDFGDIKIVRTGANRGAAASSRLNSNLPTTNNFNSIVIVPVNKNAEPSKPTKPWIARFWWLPLLLVLGVGATIWGRNYYTARYVGTDYWAQVPATQNTTPVERTDMDGNTTGAYGVEYQLDAFNEQGQQRVLEFVWIGDTATEMPQPGDFIWLSASQQLVVSQRIVPQNEVPADVQNWIAANQN